MWSSGVMSTNVASAIFLKKHTHAAVAAFLMFTSVWYHYDMTNSPVAWLDKAAIAIYMIYGISNAFKHKFTQENCVYFIILISTISIGLFLYFYGLYTNSMCFYPDEFYCYIYHGFLHAFCSLGGHSAMYIT
jgi:hypothetical protein